MGIQPTRGAAFIRRVLLFGALGFVLLGQSVGLSRAAAAWAVDPTTLSLDELMAIEITSVSKKQQKLSDAAAAVHVLTQEDIRRSGATSIPEALRMVPGLEVARIDANKWAVTSRGFNGTFANKLLVLIDGRSVFTPLFSGVYWDVQDTLLEDIDRIEVIRGPGAALWGANAVNGVINIVTKKAADTQGALVTAGTGTEETGFGGVRYGAQLGENGHYRIYAKYFDRDEALDASGAATDDDWYQWRSGFRLDWERGQRDFFTLQGDLYHGRAGQNISVLNSVAPDFSSLTDEVDVAGGNLLGRWQRTFSATSDLILQLYYDRTERRDAMLGEDRDTLDLDFQHRFALGKRQEILWGFGHRFTRDDIDSSFAVSFDPDQREDHLLSAFVQDEIELCPDSLRLTLGTKFEYNNYTGAEIQPNARLLWTPHPRHTLWAAVSRAVRTPSRSEDDMRINAAAIPFAPGELALLAIFGDRNVDSEELLAYELGYRVQPREHLFFDLAVFYNDFRKLIVPGNGTPFFEPVPAPPHLVIPLVFRNNTAGETYGGEIAAQLEVTEQWRLNAGYSYLQMQLRSDDTAAGVVNGEVRAGSSPHHQYKLRSLLDLPGNLEFDTSLSYVDSLPARDIPAYLRLDTRVGWRPSEALELSVALQNLLDDRHPEFTDLTGVTSSEVQRSIYAKVTWRF